MEPVLRPATAADQQAVQDLVFAVLEEYGLPPSPGDTDADLMDLDGFYFSAGGTFLVMTEGGEVIGCGGILPLDQNRGELRKMYLSPAHRGRGLGKKMLHALLDFCRSRGFAKVELETAGVLKEAIGLYRAHGFVPMDKVTISRCDQAMVLDLGGAP